MGIFENSFLLFFLLESAQNLKINDIILVISIFFKQNLSLEPLGMLWRLKKAFRTIMSFLLVVAVGKQFITEMKAKIFKTSGFPPDSSRLV